jgi:hypothetical protein
MKAKDPSYCSRGMVVIHMGVIASSIAYCFQTDCTNATLLAKKAVGFIRSYRESLEEMVISLVPCRFLGVPILPVIAHL